MAAPSVASTDSQVYRDLEQMSCLDFGEFQETLKKARLLDDRITNALNTSIPTDSFKGQVSAAERCQQLYEQISASYRQRDSAIKRCIQVQADVVSGLREKRSSKPDDIDLIVRLRKQQTQLRVMQTELNVEEVIKDRTYKIFHERCRHAYKPPDYSL